MRNSTGLNVTGLSALALSLAPVEPAVAGDAIPCDGLPVAADAADEATADLVCEAAGWALARFAECGLEPTRTITTTVTDRIETETPCLGLYTCETDHLEVTAPSVLSERMAAGSPYAGLPTDLYCQSLTVHETAHAVFDQVSQLKSQPTLHYEYVAYALQFSFLGPDHAETLSAGRTLPAQVPDERLNSMLLGFAPVWFGVLAHAHFGAPGRGCSFLTDLIDGRRSLVRSWP